LSNGGLSRILALTLAGMVGAAGLTACRSTKTHHSRAVVLDGRPRYPDDEGVLRGLTRRELVLDERHYKVTENLQAFSASTMETVGLGNRLSQYAQIGVNGKTAVWIAMYSAVAQLPGRPALAFHIGTLSRVAKDRVVFKDGSVLKLRHNSRTPAQPGAVVRAEIDVKRHRVDKLIVLSD
jgi:hypothetical protein